MFSRNGRCFPSAVFDQTTFTRRYRFLPNAARQISATQVLSKLAFELNKMSEKEAKAKRMFQQYLEQIAAPKEGILQAQL